jgi:hypothetical protein
MNTEQALLWNSLCNLGQLTKLKLNFNGYDVVNKLEQYKDNWCPYNTKKDKVNNRWGLPLTSFDGDITSNQHLNSFGYMQRYHGQEYKEEDFNIPTVAYEQLNEIQNIVDIFKPYLGRVHILRIDQGGYFPPHRDFPGPDPEYVRLFSVFGKSKPENYSFILDGKLINPDNGYMYFANFQLDHSVFSYSDGVYILIVTIKINRHTHDLILKHSMSE